MHRPKTACQLTTRISPKVADQPAPCDSGPEQRTSWPHTTQAQVADWLIKRLAACQGPHLKVPVLNNSYLAPAHRALQGLLAL